jgi:hypothetical protein
MFNNFFFENRAVYEIMSKNVLEPDGPQMTSQYRATRCMLDKKGCMHVRVYTRPHARVHARTN